MGNIRIEIIKDANGSTGWVYASLPNALGVREARRFARAFAGAIAVAESWQADPVTNIEIKPSDAKRRGRPKKEKENAEQQSN